MATNKMYGKAVSSLAAGTINFASDAIKAMLLSSAYAPNLDTHQFKSDLTSEITGTGYTAGGVTLTSKTVAYTAANSWGTAWAASTARTAGDIVRPATGNGFLYRAVTSGTNGASAPTWPTVVGQTVVDSGVTWVNIGSGVTVLDSADPSWASASFTARYLVFYDSTPATDATRPLISLVDFVTDQTVAAGTFTGVLAATGVAVFATG